MMMRCVYERVQGQCYGCSCCVQWSWDALLLSLICCRHVHVCKVHVVVKVEEPSPRPVESAMDEQASSITLDHTNAR